jgi:serine/threonine-protein kinase
MSPPIPFDGLLSNGTLLNKTWIIEDVLGEGGMGVVYQARHRALHHHVAIKVLDPKLARIDTLRSRFNDEARIQAQLLHPNIVRVVDQIDEGGVLGMVMELVEGLTLDDYIRRQRAPLPLREARNICLSVLDAIAVAHRKGIVHRDIKPSNILLAKNFDPENIGDSLKVMDFGIAKLLQADEARTVTGAKMGTPRFMAPEQVLNARDVDARTDLYAIGLTLYEMICGRNPYEELRDFELLQAQIEKPPPAPSSLREELPAAFEDVVLKALAKSPDDRFQNAEDFAGALHSLESVLDPAPPPRQPSASLAKPRSGATPRVDAIWVNEETAAGRAEQDPDSDAHSENLDTRGHSPNSRPWLWAILLLVLLSAGGLGYRYFARTGTPAPAKLPAATHNNPQDLDANAIQQAPLPPAVPVQVISSRSGRMIQVPAGNHPVGRIDHDLEAKSEEGTSSTLEVNSLYIDESEVSVHMYEACVDATVCPPLAPGLRKPNDPVTGVGYGTAEAFCKWAGKRLPSEKEWEAAARAGSSSIYPSGVEASCERVHFAAGPGQLCAGKAEAAPESVFSRPLGQSILHLEHIAGNVWEWTSTAGTRKQNRVVKGGSWKSPKDELRVSARREVAANAGDDDVGFRCVRDKP